MPSNKQRFIKNLSLLYISTFISGIFALIINIVLIKRLGSSVYGEYAFSLTFLGYFALIADSGLSAYGETAVSKDKANADKIIGGIFSFNIVMALFSIALMIMIAFLFKFGQIQRNMLILISIALIINTFGFNWAVKALEKNQILSLSVLIGKLAYFAGVFLFVLNKNYYMIAVLSFLIGLFLTAFIQAGYINRIKGIFKFNFSINNFKYLILNGIPFGIVSGLIILYTGFPVLFLKIFTNSSSIGFYYITNRLIVFIFILFNLMTGAFIPIISEAIQKNDKERQSSIISELIRFAYTFSIPICFGGFVVSRLLILRLFGNGFSVSIELIKIMVWSIFLVSVSSVFFGFLTALNDRKGLILSAFFTTASGLAVSFLLIKEYGVYGGALSSLIIEIVMSIGLTAFALKHIRISFGIINFLKVLAASAAMAFIVGLIKTVFPDLILCVAAGIIIYAGLSLALKTISAKDILEIKGVLSKK
ncbi:MAG: oligosaccharide flippase family protein [Deltaproteobacteria bacterium]|jgi:O-antigen/teichoic acid export membrane protein|nr:oligosaccharide flippase family protein [Deltaproteobacteria bacterium]MCL5879570.1 oligosaccharide flippase family protein [Deltaproteobacteria bacterium]